MAIKWLQNRFFPEKIFPVFETSFRVSLDNFRKNEGIGFLSIPHGLIKNDFRGKGGTKKKGAKKDCFVGTRTEEPQNRSLTWPVICKVFCRIKWSI